MATYRHLVLPYGCDRSRLPPALAEAFVELDPDASTRAWIDDAIAAPQKAGVTAMRNVAMKMVSLYDANGLVGAYSMRVLSKAQWSIILDPELARPGIIGAGLQSSVGPGAPALGRLLDVGAGDGEVTGELAGFFDEVVTTELSGPMARRLRDKGWACHQLDLAVDPLPAQASFDVIALLNLLDRMSHPLALLERLPELLAPGGRVVIAVPMPISQAVYFGPRTLDAEEMLPENTRDFETGVSALYTEVLAPRGYAVERLARAPYLCRGEARDPVKILDDAIFVLRRG